MGTSKPAKVPLMTKSTKFLCFDLETNGLHGQTFAIGALIIDVSGKVHDEFIARTEVTGEIDNWVQENILPVIEDISVTHGSYEAMREAFWRWFVSAQEKSDYVLVSNGYPVEYRFLLDCQEADLEARYWQHPFPIIDLTSLLLLSNSEDSSKRALSNKIKNEGSYKNHHPYDDAKKTALIAIEALKTSGALS